MRRSVVMAGIVVAALSVAPTAAYADTRPAAGVDEAPADCRGAAPGPGDGSGTGEPATGGDDKAADPGSGAQGSDDQGSGDAGSDDKGSGGDGSGGDGSAAEAVRDEDPPADEPATGGSGGQVDPDEEEPAGDVKQEDPEQGDTKQDDSQQDDSQQDDPKQDDAPTTAGDAPVADPAACPEPAAGPAATAPGAEASAAAIHKWGEPNRVDEFDGDLSDWSLYDGEGHAGEGRRSPDAASVKDGILTIDGNSDGTTAGMAWNPGQKYGRWEGRVRAPASDESYNALLLLWPDAEDFPVGGEVDFMEMSDHTRQETELFLHYGADNSQVQGKVQIDATQWHNWAVEWTPEKITAFVDGKEWWSTSDTSILPPGPMHLCIQLDWFPGSGSGEVTPSKMEVDWVRQYSLPESEQGGDKSDEQKDTGAEGLLDGAGQTLDRLVRRTEGAPDPAVGSAQRAPSHT